MVAHHDLDRRRTCTREKGLEGAEVKGKLLIGQIAAVGGRGWRVEGYRETAVKCRSLAIPITDYGPQMIHFKLLFIMLPSIPDKSV